MDQGNRVAVIMDRGNNAHVIYVDTVDSLQKNLATKLGGKRASFYSMIPFFFYIELEASDMNTCIETKHTLSGETEQYLCELVMLKDGIGILRYVIDRDHDISGFQLAPGDETLALYWVDRPYTLYVWHRKTQGDRAYYFNIADSVVLTPQEFTWRDLAVDILITPKKGPIILDEHELPADLDRSLADHITRSKENILANYQDLIKEAERLLASVAKDSSAGG